MFEAEVHCQLLEFIRQEGLPYWPHHLTMGRLVARTIKMKKSALIQTGTTNIPYHLSYLTPILLIDSPVILVMSEKQQSNLLEGDIPRLKKWLNSKKNISQNDKLIGDFSGIWITTPAKILNIFLHNQERLSPNIPIIIDQADYLEEWILKELTSTFIPEDWQDLKSDQSEIQIEIINWKTRLTKIIFEHPPNPYQCHIIDRPEKEIIEQLFLYLINKNLLTTNLEKFWQHWQKTNNLPWVSINREKGQFTLHLTPVELASSLAPLWLRQPVVIIGRFLDAEKQAPIFRQQLGIPELLCLKFSPSRETEEIQLYLPSLRLPLPNTPEFQPALIEEIRFLLTHKIEGFIVLLIEDTPLKSQIGAIFAGDFGSRVQVESTNIEHNTILVTGGDFWHENQENLPPPSLLVIATLPIPSLENPLVASRVAYFKAQRQDWFRHYLLPTALREIQRTVISVRQKGGIVAIFDNRINHRSYGRKILTALEPYVRINYLEEFN